ncbi:GlxA family transcriptional regulator [Photobacterium rosenbergii]|uniref:Helix-turn-helix domain-containing protein n=1 Tax=Photobacterium rosenbergii TaxID=294936 RepID=A0ABU3ZIM7_9GAMM|nr:helix-turn-helix domain-containing protein [Photobacterium rosenbergii]MDV5169872.1 helix-turn-helix domain-containing protein [Photobacterium rosenbergii]
MNSSVVSIAIVQYPNSLRSAVYGLEELFAMANHASKEQVIDVTFKAELIAFDTPNMPDPAPLDNKDASYAVVILPPSQLGDDYLTPPKALIEWLGKQHQQGSILASACAGAFILAKTGLLAGKPVTTHWGLAPLFRQYFPSVELAIDQILVNQGDVITAGGMMSWLDLGLEVVSQLGSPALMRLVGKMLVVDTGAREQRYYQQFSPSYQHGDGAIVALQHELNNVYSQPMTIAGLARRANLTERTLLRRFVKATGFKPTQYLQRLRVQKACELLEATIEPFESIAYQVGYEDAGACRKVFIKVMGLSPGEFRKRFVANRTA